MVASIAISPVVSISASRTAPRSDRKPTVVPRVLLTLLASPQRSEVFRKGLPA